MKKYVSISIVLILVFVFSSAQEKNSHIIKTQGSSHDSTMNKSSENSMCHGMGAKGNQMCCGGGMHMMGPEAFEMIMPKVYPTNDGGIIVVSGNRLTKYDGNLEKKKEIFITPNFDSLKSMLTKAAQYAPKCPMMDTASKGK